jgi:hypothetical protein
VSNEKDTDLIPIQFEGNRFIPEKISVYTSGRIWAHKEKKILDESDKDSKGFGMWLRDELLPKGGSARIDSYGNLFLRGKRSEKTIDFEPKWIEPKEKIGDFWTDVIGKLWGEL